MIQSNNPLAKRVPILMLVSFFAFVSGSTRGHDRLEITAALMQSATATLAGTVVDEKDAVIADVDVTVTNTDTGLQRQVITNSHGNFVAPHLPPGRYDVTAKRQGFAALVIKNIRLNVNDQRALRLQLKVGQIK